MEVKTGNRVIVTGASRGIGRALCWSFAKRGATIGLVARSEESLRELVDELPAPSGGEHAVLPADVGEREAIEGAIERFGEADVVVANAGIADYGPFEEMDIEAVERMTRINWLGTVYTVKTALPGMRWRGRGHFVIVSSGAALRSFPQGAVYGATKAAQQRFGEALWHELAGTGIDLTLVYPGEIATDIHTAKGDSLPKWRTVADEADPNDLAEAVLEAIESRKRAVYYPPLVQALRGVNGLSPALADVVLRRLRGVTAAPRR